MINNADLIANCFNDYFTNIGPNLANNIQPSQSSPRFTDYLSNHNPNALFLTPANKLEKTSSGHDKINISIINNLINATCKPLAHVTNTSFMTGVVPSQLKIAKVIPVKKKGDPNCVNNYRPISILSCFCKILEKMDLFVL